MVSQGELSDQIRFQASLYLALTLAPCGRSRTLISASPSATQFRTYSFPAVSRLVRQNEYAHSKPLLPKRPLLDRKSFSTAPLMPSSGLMTKVSLEYISFVSVD